MKRPQILDSTGIRPRDAGLDYFNLGTSRFVDSPGDFLGGYFQLAPTSEPSTLAQLGFWLLPLTRRLRRA